MRPVGYASVQLSTHTHTLGPQALMHLLAALSTHYVISVIVLLIQKIHFANQISA